MNNFKINNFLLALLNPVFLFLMVMMAVVFLSGNQAHAQNDFFLSPNMDIETVETVLDSKKHTTAVRLGENQLQATNEGASILYDFESDRLKQVVFYRHYKKRKESQREVQDMLMYLDRIFAVVIPLDTKEGSEWYYARTQEFRYDVKCFEGSNNNWTVMVKRNFEEIAALAK